MRTEVLFREEARNRVLAEATALADLVRVTLGPQSRRVLIGAKWRARPICRPLACRSIHQPAPAPHEGR